MIKKNKKTPKNKFENKKIIMSKSDYFDHYFKIFKNTPIYKELANIHFEIEPEYLK